MTITGKTTVTGIIGAPVAHSLSPVMHNAAFRELGLDWVFVPFPVPPARLEAAVAGLAAAGVAGFNVTIPHKVAIMPFLDAIDPDAELIGAVNTVLSRDGKLTGYNTDGLGLVAALAGKLSFDPRGRSVLVLGAGGAARSAVVSLARAGAVRVHVANRTPQGALALIDLVAGRLEGTAFAAGSLDDLADPAFIGSFDLVVNTTSVGMSGDSFSLLDPSLLKSGACVYDMVYAPPVTPLLAKCGAINVPCANGLGMLVAQGEAAFRIWTGVVPPEGCMERALATFLSEPCKP